MLIHDALLPALDLLIATIDKKADELKDVVKTGRTHLMDAVPLSMGQELSGWSRQIQENEERINSVLTRLNRLAIGGTAVGTGLNSSPEFAALVANHLSEDVGIPFHVSNNYFAAISSQDTAVEVSGHLKTLAVSLMKIANDLRWMNSGPLAGLAEIRLPELQPGSSIMPGKINPVVPEAVCMVAAQVIGNDSCITIAGQSGNFQLNVMLPLVAYNLLQSVEILGNAARALATKAIKDFNINREKIEETLAINPILVTALNREIGYEKGAEIVKRAYHEKRPILEIAKEMTNLDEKRLIDLLNPKNLL
jgi:fumarate hydratase class II